MAPFLIKPPNMLVMSQATGWQNLPLGFCVTGDDAFGSENPAKSWEAKPGVLERC